MGSSVADIIEYDALVSNVFQSILKPFFLRSDKLQTRVRE